MMSVKLEAAYHEAGHIVLAWFSKYHTIAGGIDLTKGSGQIPEIAVSKSKMSAAKKLPSKDTASNDHDVVREAAVIFTAGYQAELVAASIKPSLAPDRGSAELVLWNSWLLMQKGAAAQHRKLRGSGGGGVVRSLVLQDRGRV